MIRKLYLLLFLAGPISGIHAQQCDLPENLQTGLLVYYPFGDSGINDASGNGHDLTNASTAHTTTDRNGNADCAFQFDNLPAANEFLKFTNPAFLNGLNQMSVSLWYQAEDPTRDGGAFETLISRDDQQNCPDRWGQWSVGLYDCRRAVFGRHNSVWELSNGDCDVASYTGTWKHLVATYNLSVPEMKIYINGVLQDDATGGVNCGIVPVIIQDIGDLFIGKYYTGKIDDIFIYNREITTQEIAQLFTLGSSCCSAPLAVNNPEGNPEFSIYPNPAGATLNIHGIEHVVVKSIRIYNTLGQLVKTVPNNATTIDVSGLQSGSYVIQVDSDKGISKNKFIKN